MAEQNVTVSDNGENEEYNDDEADAGENTDEGCVEERNEEDIDNNSQENDINNEENADGEIVKGDDVAYLAGDEYGDSDENNNELDDGGETS
jgi:hypothetical protein